MSGLRDPGDGAVYTETVVWAPPQAYAADAPYQLAIVDLDAGNRLTGRIIDSRVRIGDRVRFFEYRNGVAYFLKS
jgi:uncharacterized OB-fold protein